MTTLTETAAAGDAAALEPRVAASRGPLRRPRDCAVSGVSAGLAAHLGWPVVVVRSVFVVTALFWGAGALLYAWLWAFVPWQEPIRDASAPPDADATAPIRRVPVAWLLVGGAVAAGALPLLIGAVQDRSFFTTADTFAAAVLTLNGLVVATAFAVAAGTWATLVDRRDPARGPRHEATVRLAVTAELALIAVVLLATVGRDGAVVYALIPIAGLCLVFSSIFIDRWRELSGERVKRIREEQRAEMAAHLHDSVLQTLALIQNRAGASTEVARLARAQERELRAWLYDGDSPADSDLPTDLRDYAAALELDYPVRIDVVSAGLPAERASGEVAAASREAMLNAARHAGGEVSVYIEGNANAVDVYVRDRGDGFDPDAVPADRLGVRESIIGRMRRAGGSASIRRGAGGGTEVHLRFSTDAQDARRG